MPFRCCEYVCLGVGIGALLLAALFFGIGAWTVEDGREFDKDSTETTCEILSSVYRGRCDNDDDGWNRDREYTLTVQTSLCSNTLTRNYCSDSSNIVGTGRSLRCWVHDNCRELRFTDPLATHISGWVMIALGVAAVITGIVLIVIACRRAKANEEEVSVTEPYSAPVGAPSYGQPQQGAPVQGVPLQQQPYQQQQQYPQQQYPQQQYPQQQYPQQPYQQQQYPQQRESEEPGAPPTK